MFDFEVKTNAAQLMARFTDLERRKVPWATKKALDATAADIVAAEQAEMRHVFKAPREWTVGSLTFEPATFDNGSGKMRDRPAIVRFKEDHRPNSAGYYLRPHVFGGGREHTPFERSLIRFGRLGRAEYLVPGKHAERDARGDLVPGQITKILSDLQSLEMAVRSHNWRDRGVRRGQQYTLLRRAQGVPDGIYRIDGGRRLLCFLIVSQPQYSIRFRFREIAEGVLQRNFAPHFRRELAQAVAESKERHPEMRSAG